MASFTLYTLGCGSAKPSVRHNPSSTVLDIRGNLFMIDCGEGAQKMMQKMHLKFSRLNHIFLTHLHGDHCLGLPGLIGSLELTKCNGEITIHTFEEGAAILKKIINYFSHTTDLKVTFDIIKPEEKIIFENSAFTVKSIPLKHRVPTVGFLFEEKSKPRHINREMTDYHQVPISAMQHIKNGEPYVKPDGTVIANEILTTPPTPSLRYAHISDTAYMPELAEKIGAVDLLLHETTYLEEHAKDAGIRGHSTAKEAAKVARDAGAKRLLTGHYSSRYKDETRFLDEAKEIFSNTILNHEGLVLPLD
jgi:ribonuclease Z